MGERINGAPHAPWANRWAVTALAAVSAWAFVSSFTRELSRLPDAATAAKVVVMTPAPPDPGMAPLRTYAVAAPPRPSPRPAPPLLDVPAFPAAAAAPQAPAAGQDGVPASAAAADSAAPPQPQLQPQPPPHEDPG